MHELAGSSAAVAFVAVFDNETRTRMRTLAALLDGRPLRSFDYTLAGTPCAQVVGREFRYVARGVAGRVPARHDCSRAKGMDSYAGLSAQRQRRRRRSGMLVAMGRTPIARSRAGRSAAENLRQPHRRRDRARAAPTRRCARRAGGVEHARRRRCFPSWCATWRRSFTSKSRSSRCHDKDDSARAAHAGVARRRQITKDCEIPDSHTPCETVVGQAFAPT